MWWILYAGVFTLTSALLDADWYFVPLQAVYWGCVAAGIDVAASRVLPGSRAPVAIAVVSLALAAVAVRGWPAHRAAFAQVQSIREGPYLEAGRRIASSDRPCNVAAPEIGAVGYAFSGRIVDLGGLVTPSAVHRPASLVMREQDAQWLVSQNIYVPAELAADPWFRASFERVSSLPLEPGRTVDVYKRRDGACRPN